MIAAFLAGARREIAFLRGSFWDLFLVVWLPLALLALVAVQMSAGVMRDLPVAVVDADGGSVARDLVRRLDASPGLHVAARPKDMAEAESVVRSNRAYAIVMLPQGLERAVLRGEAGRVLVLYNASYSTPSGSVLREVGAFNSFFGTSGDEAAQTTAARKLLLGWRERGTLVVVTHQVNISALTGLSTSSAEGVVLRRRGDTLQVVGRIRL